MRTQEFLKDRTIKTLVASRSSSQITIVSNKVDKSIRGLSFQVPSRTQLTKRANAEIAKLAPQLQPKLYLNDVASQSKVFSQVSMNQHPLPVHRKQPVSVADNVFVSQLSAMIDHFNSEASKFTSVFTHLKKLMLSKPLNKEFESEQLTATILQFTVRLIPQEHIRQFLQNDVLPMVYQAIFDTPPVETQYADGLTHDFVNLKSYVQKCRKLKQKKNVIQTLSQQMQTQIQSQLKVNYINNKLVEDICQKKMRQRYLQGCFQHLKFNIKDNVREDSQVVQSYLNQKSKYAERRKYMLVVFRSFEVAAAKSKAKKFRQMNDEIRSKARQLEILNRHYETELVAVKTLLQDQKLQGQLLQHQIERSQQEHAEIRNELFGVKPAQVGALLRGYYQFLFCNPYLMRFKQHETSSLPCTRDCIFIKKHDSVFVEHLLKEDEHVQNKGKGIGLLKDVSIREYLLRWTNYIQTLALQKLSDVVLIYQDQIDAKNWKGNRQTIKLKAKPLPESFVIKQGQKLYLFEAAVREVVFLRNLLNALKNEQPSDELRLLAVLFVIDCRYKFIQLDITNQPTVVWKCDVVPDPDKQLEKFMNQDQGSVQIYSHDNQGEVCFMPNLAPVLQYLRTKDHKDLVKYAEDITHTNLQGVPYQSLLMFLYCFQNHLKTPSGSLVTSQEQSQLETSNAIHDDMVKWAMLSIEPLVSRTKHQNIQDVSVLLDAQSPDQDLLNLVTLPRQSLLVKWINYQVSRTMRTLKNTENKLRLSMQEAPQNKKQQSKVIDKESLRSLNLTKFRDLIEPELSVLIVLLMTLAPDCLFNQYQLYDQQIDFQLFRTLQVALAYPTSCAAEKHTITKADRIIFIMTAVESIVPGVQLLYSDLDEPGPHLVQLLEDIVCEMFRRRPSMAPHLAISKLTRSFTYIETHLTTLSDYLAQYGRREFCTIEDHLKQIMQTQPELINHSAILVDSELVYQKIRELMQNNLVTYPATKQSVFVQLDLLNVLREVTDTNSLQQMVAKFEIPILNFVRQIQKFNYFQITLALTKFTQFIDLQSVENILQTASNFLSVPVAVKEEEDDIVDLLIDEDPRPKNEKQNPLSTAFNQQLQQQRKQLYQSEIKLHQFVTLVIALCMHPVFSTNYITNLMHTQDDRVYSTACQDLFTRVTNLDINQQQKVHTKDVLMQQIQQAPKSTAVFIEHLLTNFVLKRSPFGKRSLAYIREVSDAHWFWKTVVPKLVQPLYDFYLYEQCASMAPEQLKKFLLKPCLIIAEGLRKFFEDFSPIFPRVQKQTFFSELVPQSQQLIPFCHFVVLLVSIASEQNHFAELTTAEEKLKSFMHSLKNHVNITIKPKFLDESDLQQSEHRRKLLRGVEIIKGLRLF